jgi:hypothetical protein
MSEQATDKVRAPQPEALVVEVGHEELEHGRVRAELSGDGRLLVEKVFEGKREQFEHRLDKEAAQKTFHVADELARTVHRGRRDYRPVPDEARYEVAIRSEGEAPLTLELWQNELDVNDAARQLIRSLAEHVARASDGQAIL